MLEGLDDVGWDVLEHAYGPAGDVPDLIRALASPAAETRDKARHTLYGNIFHQGTRYEATAHAVPFLLELLADPATPDRPELVMLLARLAVGYDEMWLPDTFPVDACRADAVGGEDLLRAAPPVVDEWAEDADDEDELDDDEDEDEDGDEDRYSYYQSLSDEQATSLYAHVILAAYDAVRAGVPLLRSVVGDSDPALRTSAAYALAWFPEEAAGSLPALVPATVPAGDDDQSLTASATALVAAGMLGRAAGGDPEATVGDGSGHDGGDGDSGRDVGGSAGAAAAVVAAAEVAMTDERELVRWGAAIALAALRGPDAGREAVAELLTWAGGTAGARDDVPFLDGDVAGLAVLALRYLGDAHAGAVFDALLNRLRAVSDRQAATVAAAALGRAWPEGGPVPEKTPFAALTAPQQRLLRVLAEPRDPAGHPDHPVITEISHHLRGYGLPGDLRQLHAYVTYVTGITGVT